MQCSFSMEQQFAFFLGWQSWLYNLQCIFLSSDGKNEVKATCRLYVRLVTPEMLHDSVTIRLNKMTQTAFLSSLFKVRLVLYIYIHIYVSDSEQDDPDCHPFLPVRGKTCTSLIVNKMTQIILSILFKVRLALLILKKMTQAA